MHFYWLRDKFRKRISCSLEKRKTKSCRLSIKTSLHKHHNPVRPTYVLNTIPKNKTLFRLPTTLQGCVQTHLPPTVNQQLNYKYPMPPVTVVLVLNQQRHITQHFSTFTKKTIRNLQLEPTAPFEHSPF